MSVNKKTNRTLGSYRHRSVAPTHSYNFPYNGNPPAGQYSAKVDKIAPSTAKSSGNSCLDIFYTIKGKQGHVYHIKQRVADGTVYMDDLLDALDAKGIKVDEVEAEDVANVDLDIDLDYDVNGFGQITFPASAVSGVVCNTQKVNSMQQLLDDDEAELDEEDIEEYLDEDE